MTEFRNSEQEQARFRARIWLAVLLVLVAFGLLLSRLVWLQVARYDELDTRSERNRISVLPVVPHRGIILDRNGIVLANNYSAYTLEISPSRVRRVDDTIDALAEIVDISALDRRRFRRLREESRSFESIPIRTRLSQEEVARLAAQMYRFPGVEVRARLFRSYPLGEVGAHVIGYIGRINERDKERIDASPEAANYRGSEYIGKLGIEQFYQRELHGRTGYEEVETSAGGRAVRRLRSIPAVAGDTLVLSLDIRLQALVEDLFGQRRGALVAIDPRNGDVLAMVSSPTFDPNLFVEGIDVESWRNLNESIDLPLLNRALRGTYPPGSTFKPFVALAALNAGTRTARDTIMDTGVFVFGGRRFRSVNDRGHGRIDMHQSIVKSSNVYYYQLAHDMGVDLMHEQLAPFGFGSLTGIDLHGEVTGVLPSTAWKRSAFRDPAQQRWYAGETISLGIGQGYNHFTMLQLAHATAVLAAGGQRHEPRLLREMVRTEGRQRELRPDNRLDPLPLRSEHVQQIHAALHDVTRDGTAVRVFAGAPYRSAGKTGTAQAVGIRQDERYDAEKMAERLRDHSMYMAFAPVEQPEIALAVIVENAGFGSAAAAPIARRVFDYWLEGLYPSEEDIAAVREGKAFAPIGTPRRADEVMLPGMIAQGLPGDAEPAGPGEVAALEAAPAGSPGRLDTQRPEHAMRRVVQ